MPAILGAAGMSAICADGFTTIYRSKFDVCLLRIFWFARNVPIPVVYDKRRLAWKRWVPTVAVAVVMYVTLTACANSNANDPDPASEPAHSFQPTDQMRDLATQQCLDDPTKEQGVVQAADPNDSEKVIGEVVVECDSVR